jgi:hypothetical protein
MAKIVGDGRIVPEKDLADRCVVEASCVLDVVSDPLWHPPDWFADFYSCEFIAETANHYRLPERVIKIAPLALHLLYCTPAPLQPSKIRKVLLAERKRLEKVRSNLEQLIGAARPKSLQVGATECQLADGSVAIEFENDPLYDIVEAIDRFLERTSSLQAQPKGERPTVLHHLLRWLDNMVEIHNPTLAQVKREELCHYLFDTVREYHCDAEHRFRDHLADIAKDRGKR